MGAGNGYRYHNENRMEAATTQKRTAQPVPLLRERGTDLQMQDQARHRAGG